MRVAVIGAGVVGVTTAYELATDGHAVTVFERHAAVGSGASYANAGFVAPTYVAPWAAPGMPAKVMRHLFSRHSPIHLGGRLDAATLAWLMQWWKASHVATYQSNRVRMHRLACYSRDRLHELTRRCSLDYERSDGTLVLLRSGKDVAVAEAGMAALAAFGVAVAWLDADGCRAREPGLHPETPLQAGLLTADDEIANCRQFTHLLKREASALGVRFRFRTDVRRIVQGLRPTVAYDIALGEEPRLVTSSSVTSSTFSSLPGPATSSAPPADWSSPDTPTWPARGEENFDAVVVCAAMGAQALLRPLGIKLPLQAVYGYSLTAPLRHDDHQLHREPRGALMDERYKVAISRFGNRVRVAGCAEIGGTPAGMNRHAIATLYKVLHDWFPGIAQLSRAQLWKGARPMLPDGPPVLGASGVPGVWLNLGHGGSGWAMACGSARVLTDLLDGRIAAIDLEGLGIERLKR